VAALSGQASGREVQAPLSAVLGGDKDVEGSAKIYTGGPPAAGLPVPMTMKSFRLEYRFEKGWKFALVVPPRDKLGIPGRPAHSSVWVEWDGSGNTLRTRFRDSSGETFQSSAGEVNWKGWRRVELPLDGSGANHWSGNDDGRIDYPIRWDACSSSTPRGREARVRSTSRARPWSTPSRGRDRAPRRAPFLLGDRPRPGDDRRGGVRSEGAPRRPLARAHSVRLVLPKPARNPAGA
jgi:hypothetical protein